ncbi:MAG: bile acid:sodium symporter family protein, partial [Brevibacterium sp.]|nr:bile acid:sodium symporter family protein [Brevibacterium sp.]
MSDSSTPPPSGSQQTPNPQSQTGQTPTSSTQAPRSDRSSIIAVTALPVLVVIAGVLGFLSPDTFTPLAPTITWSLGVVMFFMGLTLTLPD